MAGRVIVRTPIFAAGGIILAAAFAQAHPDFIARPPHSAREACDQMMDPALCHVAGVVEGLRHDRPPEPGLSTTLPDHAETPGAIDPEIVPRTLPSTICDPVYPSARAPRPSWTAAARRRLSAARHPGRSPEIFALDQLVPISLGGAPTDARNLWLQSWTGTWSASRKDALEQLLNRMVCAGELSLGAAQQMIARDWIDTYRRIVTPDNLARHQMPQRWSRQGGELAASMPLRIGEGPVVLQPTIAREREAYEVPAIPIDQPFQQGKE